MHICPYGTMAIFILNKISLLEPKAQNRVRSALEIKGREVALSAFETLP